jgi:hypothetical protein
LRFAPAQLEFTSSLHKGRFGEPPPAPGGQYEWYASTLLPSAAPGPPGAKSVV